MKLVEMKCKNCGANLKINSNSKDFTCNYCHSTFKLDDEVQHVQYDNMNETGYEFEKGRIRAQKEAFEEEINQENDSLKKKKNLKWWIIGWIFFFPIPLTILIWKSKWEKNIKILVTTILWITLIILGCIASNEEKNLESKDVNTTNSNSIITYNN